MPRSNFAMPQLGLGGLKSARRAPVNIVVVANSTSSVTNGNWPAQFATNRVPWGDTITNSAVDGQDTQYMIANFATLVTAFKNTSHYRNEIIFFEGANLLDFNFNDGHGATFGAGWTNGASGYPKTAEFCALARTNGWKVRVITLDYWNDSAYNTAAFHTYFDQYNTSVRSNPNDYDGLMDFAALGLFNPSVDPNGWYNGTGIHKTSAGIAKMAAVFTDLYANCVGV